MAISSREALHGSEKDWIVGIAELINGTLTVYRTPYEHHAAADRAIKA
jgi:hypothetical protein